MENERQYLIWNKDKKIREQQLIIVTCLFDIKELSQKIVRCLNEYVYGSNTVEVKNSMDILDTMLVKRYWRNYYKDNKKTTYNDWLNIDKKELLPISEKKLYCRGMTKNEYNKWARDKKKKELEEFQQRYLHRI